MSHMFNLMFTDFVACMELQSVLFGEILIKTFCRFFFYIYYIGIRFFVLDSSETTWIVAGSAVSLILVTAAVAMLALR